MRAVRFVLIGMVIFCAKLQGMDGLPFCSIEKISKEPRCYELGINQEQLDDLRYALTALAYHSFSAILADRAHLQEAMAHVDEAHPLHFIRTVFLDRELTNCVHIMRKKQWLWRHFFNRVKRTLKEEGERDNLRPEYVEDFSRQLNLDYGAIMNHVVDSNWDGLIGYLFEQFPSQEE